jgi:hypothetical protein
LRREAAAADSAANPVPKSTTVIGSGIGTGAGGVVVGVGVASPGPSVVGVAVGCEVLVGVGVLVGGTGVAVGVGGWVVGVSAAGCWATIRWALKESGKSANEKSTRKTAIGMRYSGLNCLIGSSPHGR